MLSISFEEQKAIRIYRPGEVAEEEEDEEEDIDEEKVRALPFF